MNSNDACDMVSIIIPVYNSEKHIRDCLMSVIDQTYQNLEIIVIDDGSIDNSGVICDEMASVDKRVRVIHQENKGVSKARNEGISIATGKYMTFVDSDDIVNPNFITDAVHCLCRINSEYVSSAFQLLRGDKITTTIDYINLDRDKMNTKEYLDRMLDFQAGAYWGANWGKLYRTSIILENHILFEPDIEFAEDFRFNLQYLNYVKTIGILHTPSLQYRIDTSESLSKKKKNSTRYLREYIEIYNRLYTIANFLEISEEQELKLNAFLVRTYNAVLRNEVNTGFANYFSIVEFAYSFRDTEQYKSIKTYRMDKECKRLYKYLFSYRVWGYVLALLTKNALNNCVKKRCEK